MFDGLGKLFLCLQCTSEIITPVMFQLLWCLANVLTSSMSKKKNIWGSQRGEVVNTYPFNRPTVRHGRNGAHHEVPNL